MALLTSTNTPPKASQTLHNAPTNTCEQYRYLVAAYTDWNTDIMMRIMKMESSCDPTAHNYNPSTKDDSWGLMQVNRWGTLAYERPPANELENAVTNIEIAHEIWVGSGYQNWTTFRSID